MRWNKYTINTRTDAEELVCAMLSELGITSVETITLFRFRMRTDRAVYLKNCNRIAGGRWIFTH